MRTILGRSASGCSLFWPPLCRAMCQIRRSSSSAVARTSLLSTAQQEQIENDLWMKVHLSIPRSPPPMLHPGALLPASGWPYTPETPNRAAHALEEKYLARFDPDVVLGFWLSLLFLSFCYSRCSDHLDGHVMCYPLSVLWHALWTNSRTIDVNVLVSVVSGTRCCSFLSPVRLRVASPVLNIYWLPHGMWHTQTTTIAVIATLYKFHISKVESCSSENVVGQK